MLTFKTFPDAHDLVQHVSQSNFGIAEAERLLAICRSAADRSDNLTAIIILNDAVRVIQAGAPVMLVARRLDSQLYERPLYIRPSEPRTINIRVNLDPLPGEITEPIAATFGHQLRQYLRPVQSGEMLECGGWQCEHILVPTKTAAESNPGFDPLLVALFGAGGLVTGLFFFLLNAKYGLPRTLSSILVCTIVWLFYLRITRRA